MTELQATNKDKVYMRQTMAPINPYATAEQKLSERYHKEVGYGIKTPETAIKATYVDRKCPFTGDVTVRGRIFKAVVHSMKTERTIVVMIRYLFHNKKYKRYARKNSKKLVHMSPCFDGLVGIGDTVICGEVRPLSKNKSAVVLAVDKKAEAGKVKTFDG